MYGKQNLYGNINNIYVCIYISKFILFYSQKLGEHALEITLYFVIYKYLYIYIEEDVKNMTLLILFF